MTLRQKPRISAGIAFHAFACGIAQNTCQPTTSATIAPVRCHRRRQPALPADIELCQLHREGLRRRLVDETLLGQRLDAVLQDLVGNLDALRAIDFL